MPAAGSLGELVGLLIALPFFLLADWFKFIKELPPGQQELAKASHGAGMLALVIYSGFFHFVAAGLRHDLGKPVYWIPVAVCRMGSRLVPSQRPLCSAGDRPASPGDDHSARFDQNRARLGRVGLCRPP
jgi:hypothetical protein